MIFIHRQDRGKRADLPLSIRVVAPLLLLIALPLALVIFAVALGVAAVIAAISGLRGLVAPRRRTAPADKVIEAEYTVVAETPVDERPRERPH